ncbi:hypothetical protein PMI01_02531 [Caulobacter sp. AP07]|uniref:hypothetical protein n=1 Tax=Caulobacter sp. AP07 TaxID=1144304 RepID=UPI000271FC77|nr:hypothetical protein [Caulobacter sp. AP07]EJL32540.1 hypothetical protein PMI01_02531 [Caulobacter sp. AP07]
MKRIATGLALAALLTPSLLEAQATRGGPGAVARPAPVSAVSPSIAARYKPGAPRRAAARVTPVTSSPAQRSANPARKPMLATAANAMSIVVPRNVYLAKMSKAYEALDVQQDFSLKWQGPNPWEPLGPKVSSCVIVAYTLQPASKVKDPAHPGQYVETPESYVPADWLSWPEILGATAFEGGQCLAVGYSNGEVCVVNGKAYQQQELEDPVTPNPFIPKPDNPLAGIAGALACASDLQACMAKPSYFSKLCSSKGGVLQPVTNYGGCEQWEQFGPDSREAFLKVAALNFDAEDLNHDGQISGTEGKYLCRP